MPDDPKEQAKVVQRMHEVGGKVIIIVILDIGDNMFCYIVIYENYFLFWTWMSEIRNREFRLYISLNW